MVEELLAEIIGLAYEITDTTKHDLFVGFKGPLQYLWVEVYLAGWHNNKQAIELVDNYVLHSDEKEEELKFAISNLRSLLDEECLLCR